MRSRQRRIILFYGGPGSGKGTQAKLLAKKIGAKTFSMGEELRKIALKKTALGRKVNALTDKGILVPNYVTMEVAANFLKKGGDIIFDGYPRSLGQAYNLNRLLIKIAPDAEINFLYFDVPISELKKRLKSRIKKENRDDDKDMEAVDQRFKIFKEKKQRLVEYYGSKGHLRTIDGKGSVDDIHKRVLKVIS